MILLSEFEKRFKAKGFDLVGSHVMFGKDRRLIVSHCDDTQRIWIKRHSTVGEERMTKSFWEIIDVSGNLLKKRSPLTLSVRFVPASRR